MELIHKNIKINRIELEDITTNTIIDSWIGATHDFNPHKKFDIFAGLCDERDFDIKNYQIFINCSCCGVELECAWENFNLYNSSVDGWCLTFQNSNLDDESLSETQNYNPNVQMR